MRRFRKVHMMVVLVALVAAQSALLVGPVSADDVVTCGDGGTYAGGDNDGDLIHTGVGLCSIPTGATINGDVIVGGAGLLRVEGTVNGNIKGNTTRSLRVRDASINGDIVQEGTGGIIVESGSVSGNLEMKGNGFLTIQAFTCCKQFGSATINGNVINEGTRPTRLQTGSFGPGGSLDTITVEGSIEAEGGGTNKVVVGLGGDIITIDGNVCGGPPDGYDAAGVTVDGDINASCLE